MVFQFELNAYRIRDHSQNLFSYIKLLFVENIIKIIYQISNAINYRKKILVYMKKIEF